MVTSPAPPARPGGTVHRALLPLVLAGLVVALVLGTVLVRAARPSPPTADDLQQVLEATELGCGRPADVLARTTGFALDGTVRAVTASRDEHGPAVVRLRVREWFVGPPLDEVEVSLDPETLRHLRTRDGGEAAPGTRLLVSGRGWGNGRDAPSAAGCGRTRAWDAATAADWRARLPAPAPVGPTGPLARYPGVGFARTGADGTPTLVGVAVLDRRCLYVHDGVTRWVPVFPAGGVGWSASPAQLLLGDARVDVGHPVRLSGTPATGADRPGAGAVSDRATSLDERGVPHGCDRDAPRFVVGEPRGTDEAQVLPAPADDPVVLAVTQGARRAGLRPVQVQGEARRDAFGGHSGRLQLQTEVAGEVLVHLENVPVPAWPHAYASSDAGFAWSLDPRHAPHLPEPPAGAQLAVLDRADGRTQLLLRTPERLVVSVTAALDHDGGDPLRPGPGLQALAVLAGAAASSHGDQVRTGSQPDPTDGAAGSTVGLASTSRSTGTG